MFLYRILQLRTASLVFGHDIPFGIALLKLFRIHHIFKNPNPQKKVVAAGHNYTDANLYTDNQGLAFVVGIGCPPKC